MGLPVSHLIVALLLAQCLTGLILLKPNSNSEDVIDYEEYTDSDIFDKMLNISNADLSAHQHLLQTRPFDPKDEQVGVEDVPTQFNHTSTEYGRNILKTKKMDDEDSTNTDDVLYDDYNNNYSNQEIPSAHRRRKRYVVGHVDAKVEDLVVVDNKIYHRYLDKTQNKREAFALLRRYYGMVFAMVDQRFKTIDDPELTINVIISGILVSKSRQESAWVDSLVAWSPWKEGMYEGRVNAGKALKKFIKWLLSQKNLPKYDHAMAFTGYQLVNDFSTKLGADPGDFQVVKVATHELGHSLGSTHDGDKYNKDCPPDHNYIMAQPKTTNEHSKLKNAFYFSQCSVRQMNKKLRSDKAECVRDSPVVYYKYNLERPPPGQQYVADQQCQLIFGKSSKFCGTENMKSVMCGQLWCKDPEDGRICRTHSYLTALPGTTCATGKVCHLGVCQKKPYELHPTDRIQDNQVQGKGENVWQRTKSRGQCSADQNARYCHGLIKVNHLACRRKKVRKYCCQTCGYRRRARG